MADKSDQTTLGYYTVVQDDHTGWTGGLLLLNRAGRPLEFQCTLPVRPTKAHEILFGPTLRDHLIGEVIGPLLVKRCRLPIAMLCCDQPEALQLETRIQVPIALVSEAAEGDEGPVTGDMLTGASSIELAGATLCVPMEVADRARDIAGRFGDLPDAVEPFERIREAIAEAHSQLARAQTARAA